MTDRGTDMKKKSADSSISRRKFIKSAAAGIICGSPAPFTAYAYNEISYDLGGMLVYPGDCVLCMQCIETCPCGAITEEDTIRINPDICIRCFMCAFVCPASALYVPSLQDYRENWTVIFSYDVLSDGVFYAAKFTGTGNFVYEMELGTLSGVSGDMTIKYICEYGVFNQYDRSRLGEMLDFALAENNKDAFAVGISNLENLYTGDIKQNLSFLIIKKLAERLGYSSGPAGIGWDDDTNSSNTAQKCKPDYDLYGSRMPYGNDPGPGHASFGVYFDFDIRDIMDIETIRGGILVQRDNKPSKIEIYKHRLNTNIGHFTPVEFIKKANAVPLPEPAPDFLGEFNDKICVKCGLCSQECLSSAIDISNGLIIDRNSCTMCGSCKYVCPTGAIK